MGVKLAPEALPQYLDENGDPYSGALLFTYEAGSSTKEPTYQESTGTTPHANPIVLNSKGQPSAPIWLTEGQSYKFVLAPSTDTDPPASPYWTVDNIDGVNDTTVSIDQWLAFSGAPTYVSATQFTVTGDQTSTLHVGRRLKLTDSSTLYGTITASAYTSLTTITVTLDSGSLSGSLSAVSYGIISSSNPSIPKIALPDGSTAVTQSDLDSSTNIATTAYVDTRANAAATEFTPQDSLTGLTMSNNGTDAEHDIDVAVGSCMDSANGALLQNTTAGFTKQIDNAWAAGDGSGGFPSAGGSGLTLSSNTAYAFFIIGKTDGTIDFGFDTNLDASVLLNADNAGGSSFTLYRRIGWVLTDGSSNIYKFKQDGDLFTYDAPIADFSGATNSGTTDTKTMTAPPSTEAILSVTLSNANSGSSNTEYIKTRHTSHTSAAADATDFDILAGRATTSYVWNGSGQVRQMLDSSKQMKLSVSNANSNCTYTILVCGWYDTRGKW